MKYFLIILLTSLNVSAQTVAVIDTGIDLKHKGFKNHLIKDKKDGLQAYDFVNNTRKMKDKQGHGTHVAGIIVLQNPKIKIIPLKFSDQGEARKFDYIGEHLRYLKALEMAIGLEVDVINISSTHSLSSFKEQELLKKALEKKIIVMVASGNDNKNLTESPEYPCSYDLENVICVGNGTLAKKSENSNYGKDVDLWVPGEMVVSFIPGNELDIKSGSSQATARATAKVLTLSYKTKSFQELIKELQSLF